MSILRAPASEEGTVIKVIGVGGAGGNAVRHMIARGFGEVDFICANTDAQALSKTGAATLLKLGDSGLGAGANPEVGSETARDAKKRIVEALQGAHMVFVTAGMGGGTGTGAAPVIAEIAREMGILTVGVVTKPFGFEGSKRSRQAMKGIQELAKSVNSLVVVLNDRLLEVLGDDITQVEAFKAADDVLYSAVAGITEIIKSEGIINVDFEDVRTVMGNTGRAMMGFGSATGPERAKSAAETAISCPLLEGVNLSSAKGVLVNITASSDSLRMKETKDVMDIIHSFVDAEATVIYGAVYDEEMGDEMRVTVVATGLEDANGARSAAAQAPAPAATAAPRNREIPVLTQEVPRTAAEAAASAVLGTPGRPRITPSVTDPFAGKERPAVWRVNRTPVEVAGFAFAQPGVVAADVPVLEDIVEAPVVAMPLRATAAAVRPAVAAPQVQSNQKEAGWLVDHIPAFLRKQA